MQSQVRRVLFALVLILGVATSSAVAQYGGPGGNASYGNKGAIIGGIAGGAAVVGGLIYWKHHSRAKLQGCVTGNGDKLVSDKDQRTYSLTNVQGESLKSGQRVELVGKKLKSDAGDPTFGSAEARQRSGYVHRDYGAKR